jgi:hypothetical protein
MSKYPIHACLYLHNFLRFSLILINKCVDFVRIEKNPVFFLPPFFNLHSFPTFIRYTEGNQRKDVDS